ncbi:MAG: YbjN domain-containing protein [Rhodoferax sp.]|uniref:YbjN domain-containing protein n=1 Tax=Rhodoferax sp. TaxID=50421 RepID=UPI002ACE1DE6|nr:YbjN domain-containing protein [Rhodoferax sp.]MDZ7890875.1 YbjN domain-containing protein [Rhodoferax sp.]
MCTVIEESDVSTVNLSLELERAVIQHRLDKDGEIYVHEGAWFPFWIRIRKATGILIFTTHTEFCRATSVTQRLEFCNEINRKFILLTASTDEKKLRLDYTLLFCDGMTRETFIRSCRIFSDNINRAMAELDPDNDIALPPGQSDPEGEIDDPS